MSDPKETLRRTLVPLLSVAAFAAVAWVIHRELAGIRVQDIVAEFRATPLSLIAGAAIATVLSYLLLGCYDLLGLRYIGRSVPVPRVFLASFIASAFGHNLGVATLTGAAVRYRMYGGAGLNATDVATLAGFCGLTTTFGLCALAGGSLLFEPQLAANLLHLGPRAALALGCALLAPLPAWLLWSVAGPRAFEIRGWSLRAPRPGIAAMQVAVAVVDYALAAVVLWLLLRPLDPMPFLAFAGLYAVAIVAAIISHVPAGLGVFESLMLLGLPGVPPEQLIGALLLWRLVYYLGPLVIAALLFGALELRAQGGRLGRLEARIGAVIAPVTPQVAGTLCFVAGFALLVSGATPGVDGRLAWLTGWLPLPVLEASHLAGSTAGLALLLVSRGLFRRLRAAWRFALALLAVGVAASLLKGLDYEEAALLLVVAGVMGFGRSAFDRRSSLRETRLTPAWLASLAIAIGAVVWIGFFAQRHVDYSADLWWTFAFDGDAPRMLRALLVVAVLMAAVLTWNLLRPARPEPGRITPAEREQLLRIIPQARQTLACVALTGDKRILFSAAGDAFLMYQVAGDSWIALGDPVGPRERHEELVWRFREIVDQHGGRCVFYQVSGDRLPLYIDLGLSALKLGEEARVSLADFSLEGSARAELRTQRRRAMKDGATFEIVPPENVPALLPQLRAISDAWLGDKATAEKGFSVGFFDEAYLSAFPVAIVRTEGTVSAFANLWATQDRDELSVDLMRFAGEAPRGAMDFLFIELMLWGHAQGYRWMNLGMAPLSGLERHPLAPAWHRIGNLVFRHGEHFYNFEGLRRYKSKFHPEWEPKYLIAPGGFALPRVLVDVSVLIAGGFRELFAK